jgi:PAS domain S-box-containing protein
MSADINKTINHSESGQLFRQSGQTLQSLLEHSLDAIALVDTQGKVLYISPSVHRLLGYTADELIGRIAFELVHPDDRAKTISALVAVLQQPGTSLMVEYRLQHKDGTFRWMEATATNLLHDPNVGAIVGNFHDITERKWIETLLEGQNRVLEMVAQSAALQDVLEELVHLIEQHSSHDVFASILLLDKDGLHLRYGAAPGLPEDYNAAINDITIGPIAGSYGAAAYRREPVCVSDITTDPLWAEYKHLALAHGLQTCWSTPICSSSGKVLGTFAMYYREPRHPSPHEQQLINLVTRTVTIAIERKQAEEQAQFLAEVSKVLASTLDYQQTLANIARLVVPQLADWFVVDLVDAQGHFELVEVAHTDPDKVQWAKTLRNLFPLDPNASIGVANVVRTGQAELYPDIPDELLVAAARNEEELAIARQIGFSSGMHVPLVARG